MEAAHARSYARAIGVSNFDSDELDQLIAGATVTPVVNQVQFNPAYRRALLDACTERGVALEAYSPLGTGGLLGEPVVTSVADRLGRRPPRSFCAGASSAAFRSSRSRRAAIGSRTNAQIFDFQLGGEDMDALDALDRTGGTRAALERKWW